MNIIYLLIPVSLVLLGLIVWILLWAVRSGQFDDLEGPAHRILLDEERVVEPDSQEAAPESAQKESAQKNSRRGGAG